MQDSSIFRNSRTQLRAMSFMIMLVPLYLSTSVFFKIRSKYNSKENGIYLQVYINNSRPLNTQHKLNINGSELIYGTIGTLYYHPKSLFECFVYRHYADRGRIKIMDNLFILCLGGYLFVLSFFIGKNEFFNEKTFNWLFGLIFLAFFLCICRAGLMEWVDEKFYLETSKRFNLSSEPNFDFFLLYNFCLIIFIFLFNMGRKVQKEQELTI